MVLEVSALLFCIKELFLCFQKLVSGELHTFYFGRFPEIMISKFQLREDGVVSGSEGVNNDIVTKHW